MIPARQVRDDAPTRHRRANQWRPGQVDECFLCGRGLTDKALAKGWWVHVAAGNLVPATLDVPEADDLGWFPVGSGCATRVPLEYRVRLPKPR